jgi:hypothetical protein
MGAESLAGDQTGKADRLRRLVRMLQRAMVRTDRGPLRSLWTLAYALAARCYAAYVRRGEAESAAFVKGSIAGQEEVLHGVSDIDMVVVVAPDPAGRGLARERVRRRCRRVSRALPVLGDLLFGWPSVYEDADLVDAQARSALTYRRSSEPGLERSHALYSGADSDDDRIRLAERPMLYGPTHDWRLIAGPDRRPARPALDADSRRIASWLELQYWWQWAFDACVHPDQLHNASLCVKLLAEPVRIWLWLASGEAVDTRADALARGPAVFPAEDEAFQRGIDLHRRLRSAPPAPLAEVLPAFVRMSEEIARELAGQVEPAGWTEVRLDWSDREAFFLPNGDWRPVRHTRWDEPPPSLLPLADWRALVSPSQPDDTLALIEGDVGDPGTLAAAALALDRGPYPTLTTGELQLRPVETGGRRRLRTVQCPATDPVSFALADGATGARFPNVAGFSLQDTAARAVAEHSAWLATTSVRSGIEALGPVITAARAGLLWETVEAGEPELQLTADATLAALGARGADFAGAADAARESYLRFVMSWLEPPPESLVAALRDCVTALPAYASSRAKVTR